jgi:outer membrane protein assembly factor BamD (BamD/ComL family)
MRKIIAIISFALALGLGFTAPAFSQAAPDEKLFQEAKLLVFDKDWDAALQKLDELRNKYPFSPWAGQALFYKGECLSSLGGREGDALQAYKDYIQLAGAKPSLVEDSEGSIVDLAFALYQKGDRAALKEIEGRLGHANKTVRYYAAYKLSLVKDKAAAAKAVPVLEQIIRTEKDPELTDRARIALLRVSPESLKSVESRRPSADEPHMFHLRITQKGSKEKVELNLPWALADLVLSAMDEEDKASLRAKGYDVNKIMKDVARSKGTILRIEGEDGSVFEIWID